MRPYYRVTYLTVKPDTDKEERGYILPGEWHQQESTHMTHLTLREAVKLVGCMEDAGHWFNETDGRIHCKTGDVEYRAFHPPSTITPSSYRRLARLLGVRA